MHKSIEVDYFVSNATVTRVYTLQERKYHFRCKTINHYLVENHRLRSK